MKHLITIGLFFLGLHIVIGQSNVLWQIGESDNSSDEFALSPDKYDQFLEKDFGWEDRMYFIGSSKESDDFPYVLPGAIDYWGGTSGMSGIRPHELNLFFGIDSHNNQGAWKLIIDVLDCSSKEAPLLKVVINGKSHKIKLEKGTNENSLEGKNTNPKEQIIEIPIEAGLITNGGNDIKLTILEGSWLVFDQVRLEGPKEVNLINADKAFLRSVYPANYELIDGQKRFQPLLIDVAHITDVSRMEVILDGMIIFDANIENGRKLFEAPMLNVDESKISNYTILLDGEIIQKGTILRKPQPTRTIEAYVDTKIGTGHSRWMIAPGPWMPFSMVKISPDNQNTGWQAGYQPTFESIGTFSHIHEWTMAGLGTFPTNGTLKTKVGSQGDPDSGYRSRIDKSSEQAPIGYYSVQLSDYDIKAELTATTRCSFQRYTYPEDSIESRVLVDLMIPSEYNYQIEKAYFKQISDYKIVGYSQQVSKSIWGERYYRKQMVDDGDEPKIWDDIKQEYTVHFVIEFDQPIKSFGVHIEDSKDASKQVVLSTKQDSLHIESPHDVVAFIEFDTSQNRIVQTRTGISYVSIDKAELNLQTEIVDNFNWSFDNVRKNQERTWEQLFDRVYISTYDQLEKTRFYSNMYRALVSRNIFSDVDGSWMDATEKVRQFSDPNDLALGCDAFWNTFWNLNQFWNLIVPDWSSKWVKSQLAMYQANGWLAKGPAGMEYIPVMVAEHEIPLIVSAYQMGIRDFDEELAFEAVYKMQTKEGEQIGNGYAGNRDLRAYLSYGYVPYNKGRFSNTLEYSFDDFAVAQFAKNLNKEKEYKEFNERSNWWKNAIDTDMGFARLKHSDGSWYTDFDPIKTGGNHQYVEGNAWQLTYFVPQDIPALAEMIGESRFIERLNEGFEMSSSWRYNAPNEKYWDFPVIQGNQQSMHFAYLFNWVKKPWLTQKWVRDIMDRYYGYGVSNAYLGDEDQGQMSAWFIMASLGLFQTDGGTRAEPIYEIASPLFEKVEIDLGNRYNRGEKFIIESKNTSFLNKYVQSAELNGERLENFWFPASELLKGGKLELIMGPEPNKEWGRD